jgi:16S rRNA (cytosine1402-N4)-methyltransferase
MRVNDELGQLSRLLVSATDLLVAGGRVAVISFHSLEDRLVKEAIRRESAGCRCPREWPVCRCDRAGRLRAITKRPVTAGEAEVETNPRARSAKLRAAERI